MDKRRKSAKYSKLIPHPESDQITNAMRKCLPLAIPWSGPIGGTCSRTRAMKSCVPSGRVGYRLPARPFAQTVPDPFWRERPARRQQQLVTPRGRTEQGTQLAAKLMIDPTGRTEVGGQNFAPGFFGWNSGVGRRSFGVTTFWYRCAQYSRGRGTCGHASARASGRSSSGIPRVRLPHGPHPQQPASGRSSSGIPRVRLLR
jgi:hypothetical protein